MRCVSVLVLLLVSFFVVQTAQAGSLTIAKGETKWAPTKCAAPSAFSKTAHNPEAAADDLNARLMQHKDYVAAVESYMTCVAGEAQGDAEAASRSIMNSASQIINEAQSEADMRTQALSLERAKVPGNN